MKRLTIVRLPGDRRFVVGLGAAAAIAVAVYAVAGAHQGSGATTAHASARVLIDTTESQLVNAGSEAIIALPLRANLVADELATNQMRVVLARGAGVPPRQLDVLAPASTATPAFLTPLVNKLAPMASAATAPYVVSLYTDGETSPAMPTPVILIETQAPDPRHANTLARATIGMLTSIVAPQQAGEPADFVVRTITAPHRVTLQTKPRRVAYGIVGAIMLFVLWCVGTSLATSISRRLRRGRVA